MPEPKRAIPLPTYSDVGKLLINPVPSEQICTCRTSIISTWPHSLLFIRSESAIGSILHILYIEVCDLSRSDTSQSGRLRITTYGYSNLNRWHGVCFFNALDFGCLYRYRANLSEISPLPSLFSPLSSPLTCSIQGKPSLEHIHLGNTVLPALVTMVGTSQFQHKNHSDCFHFYTLRCW